jgi:hypothetical protein
MLIYIIFFILFSPGIVPAIVRGAPIRMAFNVPLLTSMLSTLGFWWIVYVLHHVLEPRFYEYFQMRGEVGSERSKERKLDARGNRIRTCASDFDCSENEVRTSCKGGICKDSSA